MARCFPGTKYYLSGKTGGWRHGQESGTIQSGPAPAQAADFFSSSLLVRCFGPNGPLHTVGEIQEEEILENEDKTEWKKPRVDEGDLKFEETRKEA